jgi:tripartite-type tricarboxylate transporter receptor subunit TctC
MLKFVVAALAAVFSLAHTEAQAQAYPSKPIRFVIPFGAGSATDALARIAGQELEQTLGQPIIVVQKPGADGALAAGEVKRAAPDGYTFMFGTNSPLAVAPNMQKEPPYNVLTDFTPISFLGENSFFIVVHPSVPAKDMKELIALLKANPGKFSYASTGVGTQLHIGMEMFKLMTKTDILHVPYRATTAAMADLMGGRIDLILIGLSSAKAQVEGGKLRAYAIAAPQRSTLMPDVPSADEAGLPGYEVRSWFGMFAPAKTPQSVVDRLSSEIKQASTDPRFIAALAPQGMQIVASSPSEMAQSLRDDYKKWGEVIRETGTKINQ